MIDFSLDVTLGLKVNYVTFRGCDNLLGLDYSRLERVERVSREVAECPLSLPM